MLRESPPSYDEGRRIIQTVGGSTPQGGMALSSDPQLIPIDKREEAKQHKAESDYNQMKEHASAAWKAGCNFLSEKFKRKNDNEDQNSGPGASEKCKELSQSAKVFAKEKGQAIEEGWVKSKAKLGEGVDNLKKKYEEKNFKIMELFKKKDASYASLQPNSEDALFSANCKSNAPLVEKVEPQ
mmetsp:Transcript_22008/g.34164  ORF Transcript_22008/g.34164 Transcript_22008/m.34164 type:complete len:183 (+) Transcript_22008:248-796(+)